MEYTPKEIADMLPELSDAYRAFPAGELIEGPYNKLTPIALKWQEENPNNWGTGFFSDVFYKGVDTPLVPKADDGISDEDRVRAFNWVEAAIRSYYPKHEHKEVVCALIWETFFEEPVAVEGVSDVGNT